MNLCLHFAFLEQHNTILSSNSIPPSLLTTLLLFPNCYLFTLPCHLTILPPFPLCYLTPLTHLSHHCHPTPLTHLSHPPNSPLSHLSQLTSPPRTSRHL